MAQEPLNVPIKSTFDPKGTKEAEKELGKVKKAGDEASDELKKLGYSADTLKESLLGLVAFSAVVAQFKEGFMQVAAMEQSFNALERAANRNGANFQQIKEEVEEFAGALSRAAGIDDDVAVPAMVRVYNATGDLEKALTLTRLAADVSVGGMIDFAAANDLVLQAAAGNTRGLRQFGIVIDENLPKKEKARQGLIALDKAFKGAAENASGARIELNKLGEAWEDFRNPLVQNTIPAITWAFKAVRTGVEMAGAAIATVINALMSFGRSVGVVWDAAKAFLSEGVSGWKREIARVDEIAKDEARINQGIWEQAAERYASIWEESTAKVALGHGDVKKAVIAENESTRKEEKLTYDAHVRLFHEWQKDEKERAALEKALGKNRVGLERDVATDIAAIRKGLGKKILDDLRDQNALEKELQQERMRRQQQIAEATSNLLGALFGDSKEVAIAQALINTYQGATKALAEGGIYGIILMALVIAAGLAQVANIEAQEFTPKAGGFDDPSNDMAAYMGGRKWAADMVRHFSSGASSVSAGWAAGMGATTNNSTVDNSRVINVTVQNPLDAPSVEYAKRFLRVLQLVDKNVDGGRTIARRNR